MRGSGLLTVACTLAFIGAGYSAEVFPAPDQQKVHRAGTNQPKVYRGPVRVSPAPVPPQPQPVTPGGTFNRSPTFSTQPGSFGRPSSTFSHPGSSYTPLNPILAPPGHYPGQYRSHYPRTWNIYPQMVIIQNPVVYDPYYNPYYVGSGAPVETAPVGEAQPQVETAPPVVETPPPVVFDFPPGAVVRKAPAAAAPVAKVETAAKP